MNSTNVNPGYGYRLLQNGEMILSGDEYNPLDCGWWPRFVAAGQVQSLAYFPTRRKIDPGEGWEIVPADERPSGKVEATNNGVDWAYTSNLSGIFTAHQLACQCSRLAYRRRKQTQAEWLDISVVKPSIGDHVWFQRTNGKVMLCDYLGFHGDWKCWRPVKPGEIQEPPKETKPPKQKTQAEIDNEDSSHWYRTRSDFEDELCEMALRQAYEAGRRDERSKASLINKTAIMAVNLSL